MSEFEFLFPLFSLLIGLSMADMLRGLAHALNSKRDIRIGWLTPLLGTLILINLAMFWQGSWAIREEITATSGSILLLLAAGGAYFLAASMVFPPWGADVRDLDDHFMEVRRVALLAIAGCNLGYFVRIGLLTGESRPGWWLVNGLFLALLVVAALVPNRRLIAAILWVQLAANLAMLVRQG